MLRLVANTQTTFYSLQNNLKRLARDTKGATAIEYGLIAAGIAVAIIAAVFALGDDIKGFFEGVSTQLQTKAP
jgi:pilus assembly protein Flp/PilA